MIDLQQNRVLVKAFFLAFFLFSGFPKSGSASNQNFSGSYTVDLYGHCIEINIQVPATEVTCPVTLNGVYKISEGLNPVILNPVLEQMDSVASFFGMDDMAYLLFASKVAHSVYKDETTAKVFLYKLLAGKGYRSILGFNESGVTVYGQFDFAILNTLYVQFGKFTYYDVSFTQSANPVNEELALVNEGGRSITLNESRPPHFNALTVNYHLYFEYDGMMYFFDGKLNQSLVEYYTDLPDIEFGQVYLNYHLSDRATSSLVADLRQATNKMFPGRKLDFLLQFAQNAIPYMADKESIGKEKFSFPEEVLASSFADCEDKSVLFAYLAREVLDLQSLGLVYYSQHHLNVAVQTDFPSDYNFTYHNHHYLVCEPSGAGFRPGDNAYDVKKASIVSW